MCVPRFDSPACFAALLGGPEHGHWQIAPSGTIRSVSRRYRDGTLVLETDFETDDGAVRLIDLMPMADPCSDVVRIVEGLRGTVEMEMELVIRFDYGSIVPWVEQSGGSLLATAGPDTLVLDTPVQTHGENMTTVARFTVAEGERVPFVLHHQALARQGTVAGRGRTGAARHDGLLARVVGPLHLPWALASPASCVR